MLQPNRYLNGRSSSSQNVHIRVTLVFGQPSAKDPIQPKIAKTTKVRKAAIHRHPIARRMRRRRGWLRADSGGVAMRSHTQGALYLEALRTSS